MKFQEKKDMTDGKLFIITSYIYSILLSSVLFILTNLVFVYALIVSLQAVEKNLLPIHIIYLTLLIAAIPMGPSITALFSVMRKIINHTEISIIRDFFRGYRNNFKQSMAAWMIILSIGVLFSINYIIIVEKDFASFLIFPLYIFISFLICMTFYIFPLIAQYFLRLRDVFKLSLYFVLKEFKTTFSILLIISVSGYLFLLLPTIFSFILPGGAAYLIMYLTTNVFESVKAKYKEANTNMESSVIP